MSNSQEPQEPQWVRTIPELLKIMPPMDSLEDWPQVMDWAAQQITPDKNGAVVFTDAECGVLQLYVQTQAAAAAAHLAVVATTGMPILIDQNQRTNSLLERQNGLLEKQNDLLERQNELLEKRAEMVEKLSTELVEKLSGVLAQAGMDLEPPTIQAAPLRRRPEIKLVDPPESSEET